MDPIVQLTLLGTVLVAAFLGGVIGWEREYFDKPAGFRTHILVASASALIVLLANALISMTLESQPFGAIRTDPIRAIEAIVVGISFIGAGVILKDTEESKIRNITTAASVLFTAVIGIAAGIGLFYLAAGATALIVAVNWGLRVFEEKVHPRHQ